MVALCVDDEQPLLDALVRAVGSSPDVTQTVPFRLCSQALEWAQQHRPDVAFLDISMRGMGGLELAERLRQLYPALPVVFCTGYRDYAVDAFRLHVSGYLLKPIRTEDIQRELDVIRGRRSDRRLLQVTCFGEFGVAGDGRPLHFKRKRSKELLAYLVSCRGTPVSAKKICAVLWEDDTDDRKNTAHLYKLFADLRDTLTEVGAAEVLLRTGQEYAVDPEKLDCDYYRYLAGDPAAARFAQQGFMNQYSWAEEINASFY